MKLLFISVLLFVSQNCLSQNYSLKDISKCILKAINDKDTLQVNKVLISYEENLELLKKYQSANSRKLNGAEQNFYADQFYTEMRSNVMLSIRVACYSFFGSELKETPGKLKYLNFSYQISGDPNSFAKKAVIGVYAKAGTKIKSFLGIFCYKIGKSWKIAGMDSRSFTELRDSLEIGEYEAWSKKTASSYTEDFPYHSAKLLWDIMTGKGDSLSKTELLLTVNEYSDLYKGSLLTKDDYAKNYSYYLHDKELLIKGAYDSLLKYPGALKDYSDDLVIYESIYNHPYETIYGKGYYSSFSFATSFRNDDAEKRFQVGINMSLIFINNKWKLYSGLNWFAEMEDRYCPPLTYCSFY